MGIKLRTYSIAFLVASFSIFYPPKVIESTAVETEVDLWITKANARCGEEFCAEVRIRDFTNINGISFSLNWDPNLIRYNSASLTAMSLSDGGFFDEGNLLNGELGFRWQNTTQNTDGLTLDRDQVLITVCMEDRVNASTTVPISFADSPIAQSITGTAETSPTLNAENIRAVFDCDNLCQAIFSFSTLDSCGSVQFFNESIGDSLSYNWSFGDGNSSQLENPQHTYLEPRIDGYEVLLDITRISGCQDNTSQNVVIMGKDETVPIIICPKDTVVDCSVDLIPENTGEPFIEDNCGINDVELTYNDEITTEANCSKVIKRTWVIIDKSNNIETCVQIISVVDQTGPTIEGCPAGIAVNNSPGQCGADVTIVSPIAVDACNQVISLINNYNNTQLASSFYPIGTTVVTWTALDDCGNITTSCSHSITVMDIESPTIECTLTDTTIQANRGAFGAIYEFDFPTPQDNCEATVVSSHQSGDFFPCGETLVTFTAVDSSGNTSTTCSFTVTVACDLDIEFTNKPACGMAVTTRYSGNRNSNNPENQVIEIVDVRERNFPFENRDLSEKFNSITDPRWSAFNVGEVFGTTIDDEDFIYVAATSIYPENYFGANQENTGGEIYRINPDSGGVELFVRLPNTGQGIGNICFVNHRNKRLLFATNWEDGFIYRIDIDTWNGMPDAMENYSATDIFQMDNDTLGYAPLGQLTWGIGYNPIDEKLYFGRWTQNGGELNAPNNCTMCEGMDASTGVGPNTLHSVSLDDDGSIELGALKTEITLDRVYQALNLDTLISNPISDIAFSATGNLLITEKSMCCPDEVGGGRARILEYEQQNDLSWSRNVDKTIYIGASGSNNATNSAGGIDYGYAPFNSVNFDVVPDCDSIIWATADITPYNTYGIMGIPAQGNDNANPEAFYINLTNETDGSANRMIGDVEIFKCGCAIPRVGEFCDSLSVARMEFGQPDSCCWTVDLVNRWDFPYLTRLEVEILNPDLQFNSVYTNNDFIINIENGQPNQLLDIRFLNGNLPMGAYPGSLEFCFAGGSPTESQKLLFKWYEQIPGLVEEIACTEELTSVCLPSMLDNPCARIVKDTVFCDTLDFFSYEFTIRNDLDRPINKLYLFPDSLNSNFKFSPSIINLISPLTSGDSVQLMANITSDTLLITPTTFNFRYAVSDNGDDFFCTSVQEMQLTLETCCSSCESSFVNIDSSLFTSTDCCYSLDIFNECPENDYRKIELELLTPAIYLGSISTDGIDSLQSKWSNPIATPTKVQWVHESGTIPFGTMDNLINFCLDSVTTQTLDSVQIAVRWLEDEDFVACVDTLNISCIGQNEQCAFVDLDTIMYIGDGQFKIDFVALNTSGRRNPSELFFQNLSPDSICISPIGQDSICKPQQILCNDTQNGVCNLSFILSNAQPKDTIAYQVGFRETLDNLNTWNWTCFESDTFSFVLPTVPALVCPGDITLQCCGMFELPEPIIQDTAGNARVDCTRGDGRALDAPFTKGITDILCISSNSFGQTDTCRYQVIVVDTISPIIECPAIRDTLFADQNCIGVLLPDYTMSSMVVDSCITGLSVIQTPAPGTFLPPGKYQVGLSAVDACLNIGNCEFEVAVICDASLSCDSLVIDYQRDTSVPDSCCYEIVLTDLDDGIYPNLQLHLPAPAEFVEITAMNGWSFQSNPNQDTLIFTPMDSLIGNNDIGSFARICTDGFSDRPNPVYLDWFGVGIDDDVFIVCSDTLQFDCETVKCCQSEDVFLDRVSELEVDVTQEECFVEVTWSGLNECDRIKWIWGDSSETMFVLGDTTLRHTYSSTGPHEVCYIVEEVRRNGEICWADTTCLEQLFQCDDLLNVCVPCNENTIVGPNLIQNSDFEAGNDGSFSTDYQVIMNDTLEEGQISIQSSNNIQNPSWAGIDRTNNDPNGLFLTVNSGLNSNLAVWKDTVPVTGNQLYTFCAYVNNLTAPSTDVGDPIIRVQINGSSVVPAFSVSENPDLWLLVSSDWTASPADTQAIIEILSINAAADGFDFGLDDLSFRECAIDTCQADFDFEFAFDIGNNNCGTINFENLSEARTELTYLWEFGDDSTSTSINPTHQYFEPGIYTACLTINSRLGCMDQICKEIDIRFNDDPPIVECNENIVISATTEDCEAIFTPQDPRISIGICSTNPLVECSRDDGKPLDAPYPVGNTVVTCRVTDRFGTSSCSYLVTVTDENCDDICCINQDNFVNRVDDGFTYVVDNCELTITPNNLNECHQVVWSWGDNTMSRSVGLEPVIHEYQVNDTFEICMEVIEVDENGNACYPNERNCMDIAVACDTTCTCGLFEGFAFGQDIDNLIPLTCNNDEAIELPCTIPGQTFNLIGNFACVGVCDAEEINLQLVLTDSIIDLGSVILNDGKLNASIVDEFIKFPGNYTVRLSSQCGSDSCECDFNFIVPEECDCNCDEFQQMVLQQGQDEYSILCNQDTTRLNCPADDITISGFFECQGLACTDEGTISWSLNQPDGTTISNSTIINEFEINLSEALLEQPGIYTLNLQSLCGLNNCGCQISWEQPDCDPCACPVETFEYSYQKDCNLVTFDFSQTESCDTIKLDFGDGTEERFLGGTVIQHWYLEEKSYDVCYHVKRTDKNGSGSCQTEDCFSLFIDCSLEQVSNNAIIVNGGFNEVEGFGPVNWTSNGDIQPVFINRGGCIDSSSITFRNTIQSNAIQSIQQEVEIPAGEQHEIIMCLNANNAFSLDNFTELPKIYLIASNSDIASNNFDACVDCEIIGITPDINVSNEWITVRLADWTPSNTYSIITVVLASSLDVGLSTNYELQIDNLYLGNLVLSKRQFTKLEGIQVYPNPTDHSINIVFDRINSSNLQLSLRNPLGATVYTKNIASYTKLEQIDLSTLPKGIYILELFGEQPSKIYREKIVLR